MHNPIHTLKLSVKQFLEAAGDENRFYTARALNKAFEEVTVEECITHYIHNTSGVTPIGFDVTPASPPDMWQYQFDYSATSGERL